MNDNFEKAFEAYLDRLRESGALEIEGVDDDGEIVYRFNVEIMKSQFPELWQAHMDEVDESILELQTAGLVELDFTTEDVGVTLTDKGREYIDIINQT